MPSTIAHILHLVEKYNYRKLPKKISESSQMMYLEALPEWLVLDGDPDHSLFTKKGTPIAEGYERVVIGDYGAYVEVRKDKMHRASICVKKGEEYRYKDPHYAQSVKYYHYTTKDDSDVKIYFQQRVVTYADYKPDFFYISVYEVCSGQLLARELQDELRKRHKLSRNKSTGSGKAIGGKLYLTKECSSVCKRIDAAHAYLPDNFDYQVLRVDEKGGEYSFVASPDWNESNEPIVGESYTVKLLDEDLLEVKHRKANTNKKQIYHHKWLFSGGHSIEEIDAMRRSLSWLAIDRERSHSSKIGYADYWDAWLKLNRLEPRRLV